MGDEVIVEKENKHEKSSVMRNIINIILSVLIGCIIASLAINIFINIEDYMGVQGHIETTFDRNCTANEILPSSASKTSCNCPENMHYKSCGSACFGFQKCSEPTYSKYGICADVCYFGCYLNDGFCLDQ